MPKKVAPVVLHKRDIKFDVVYLKSLLDTDKIKELEAYLRKFFFRYKTEIFFFDGVVFELYEQYKALKLIPNDCVLEKMVADEETKKFKKFSYNVKAYLQSTDFMQYEYQPSIDFSQGLIYTQERTINTVIIKEAFLNMAKPMRIDVNSPPVKITDEIKGGLELIDKHLYEIWCSKNNDAYEFVMNFIACTLGGRKVRKCIYLQTPERLGKGIIINGLLGGILGDRMCKTSSTETIEKYTKPMEGCALVNFDELPVEGSNWKSVSDKLKSLITEPEFDARAMHSPGYTQKNTFNIISTTNNNAVNLTQNNKSRYVMLDCNESRIGDTEYFDLLTGAIKNPDVRLAFYQLIMKRYATLTNWNEDIEITTENKLAKIIESLPQFHKFIKENYVLKNLGFTAKTNEFFENYFKRTPTDRTSKIQIGKYLKSMGVEPKKIAENKKDGIKQHYIYEVKNKELYDVFIKNKWINETVDVINDENYEEEETEETEAEEEEEEEEKAEEKPTSIIKQTPPIHDLIVEDVEVEEIVEPKRKEKLPIQLKVQQLRKEKEARKKAEQQRNVVEETDTLFDMEL